MAVSHERRGPRFDPPAPGRRHLFDDRIWTSGRRSESGWRDYDPGDTSGKSDDTVAILEHRDHVHVDVA